MSLDFGMVSDGMVEMNGQLSWTWTVFEVAQNYSIFKRKNLPIAIDRFSN